MWVSEGFVFCKYRCNQRAIITASVFVRIAISRRMSGRVITHVDRRAWCVLLNVLKR